MTDARDIVERRARGEQRLGIIRKPEFETLIQRLSRRIHNQRARIRQMDGFHWGASHGKTIHRYCLLVKKYKEERHKTEALNAENASLRKQLEDAREALDGYRAAVSFISADSWDGCSDCINILKAARCADMTEAMTIDETAEHLRRIRLHYDPAALCSLPTDDGWEEKDVETIQDYLEMAQHLGGCEVFKGYDCDCGLQFAINKCRDAKAALGPLAVDDGWEDITTAPQNTPVLVYGIVYAEVGPGSNKKPIISQAILNGDYWMVAAETYYYLKVRPTHWRPLPAPPSD